MKIRILKNTVADCKCVNVNDVLDISEKNARYLIALGKAEVFAEVEAPAVKAEPETVDTLPDEPSEHPKKRKGKN